MSSNTNGFSGNSTIILFTNVAIQEAPERFALPPLIKQAPPISASLPGNDNPSQPSVVVLVLVPLVSVFLVSFLILAAYNSWKYHRKRSEPKPYCSEFVYDEQEPLKPVNKVEGLDLEMQIIHGADKVSEKKREEDAGNENAKNNAQTVIREKSQNIAEAMNQMQTNTKCTVVNVPDESAIERPKTLKFLAASVAFQYSTVAAVERLPYTPDPDSTLCLDGNAVTPTVNGEAQDRLTPLLKPKRKMKPRGLLESSTTFIKKNITGLQVLPTHNASQHSTRPYFLSRVELALVHISMASSLQVNEIRGSNVALTISLRSGDKNSSCNTAIVNTKSPKPLAYLQKASSLLTPDELHEKSCDTLRLQQEFWEIPMNHPSEKDFNVPGHGTKNRYRTILPNEHSRVQLGVEEGGDSLSSYINANYIRDCTDLPAPKEEQKFSEDASFPVTRCCASFIATQGPMSNTLLDFWRMILQEQTSSIVMITKLRERKEKCAQYLPLEIGDHMSFDDISIKVLGLKKFEHFTVRSLEIIRGKDTRQLRHFWYTAWMDHETPEKTRGLLELVQEVSIWNKSAHGPIVVHCSAGIGRTGCYIAVTVGCQQLMKTGKTDILRLVSQMRLDRGGMIQTWEQYQFVHQALSRYGRILAGENVTTPSTTGSIRSPPMCLVRDFGINKKHQSLERPSTPKHQRSLSETNLPSPKEIKLNLKNSETLNLRNHEKKSADNGRSLKLETPPLGLPKSGVMKSASSPTIRSPFGRLCLQNKDLNSTVVATPVYDKLRETDSPLKDLAEMSTKMKIATDSQNGFSFPTVSSPSKTSSTNKSATPSAKSTNTRFAFPLPITNPPAAEYDPEKLISISPTNETALQSSKASTVNACFFFPSSER